MLASVDRGKGLRRDGPGARRFAQWRPPAADGDRPERSSGLTAAQITGARRPSSSTKRPSGPVDKAVPEGWPASSDLAWVVAAVAARSGGRCEARLDGCDRVACHRHHRKRRREGDHRPVNLVHLCSACHGFIHANVAWARVHGWILSADADPEQVAAGVLRE